MVASRIELVIFDCDGVLVDSEPISVSVLCEVLREAGRDIAEDVVYRRFLGRSMASVVSALELDYGLVITRDHLAAIRRRLFERFATELLAVDGVEDAIRAIDVPFCVASSSQLERIRYSLQVTGLLEYFDPRLYSSSMVTNGKPAPDLFLHAATAMDVAPAHCLVIEDSGAGIMAARRAGMRVFAFVGATHAGPANLRAEAEALAPDAIFSRMRDLPALIRARTRKAKDG